MNYPGHLVKIGEPQAAVTDALQAALHTQGYGPFAPHVFDGAMESVVMLFQSQHVDRAGKPLDCDGKIGPLTWAAIFGAASAPPKTEAAPTPLGAKTVEIAKAERGTMEVPPGSNRGPRVDQYLDRVGIPPSQGTADERYWCMAFAYFCVDEAARALSVTNSLFRTAGVLDQWNNCQNRTGVRCITRAQAIEDHSRVQPGQLLILDHGHGLGHTGIVIAVDGPNLDVIEGNASNKPNDRNGVGVFETSYRKITDPQVKGFIACG